MLTGAQIAKDALEIQRKGCGYIWGTDGITWTQAKQWALEDEYNEDPAKNPSLWGSATYGSKWIGKTVYDCSGLIKAICEKYGLKLPHGSNSQYNQYMARKGLLKKGFKENGEELRPGTLVFMYDAKKNNRDHVGVYVGNKEVVEAKGGQWGVVKSLVSRWDEWGEIKGVAYTEEEEKVANYPTLRKGDKGDYVTMAQQMLAKHGSELTVDGVFGSGTQTAVRAFQKRNGLDSDGVIGPKTWAVLQGSTLEITVDKNTDMTEVNTTNGHITITLDMESAKQIFLALKAAGVDT